MKILCICVAGNNLFCCVHGNLHNDLNLNLNSLLVKRQIDNPLPGAVTGGN